MLGDNFEDGLLGYISMFNTGRTSNQVLTLVRTAMGVNSSASYTLRNSNYYGMAVVPTVFTKLSDQIVYICKTQGRSVAVIVALLTAMAILIKRSKRFNKSKGEEKVVDGAHYSKLTTEDT